MQLLLYRQEIKREMIIFVFREYSFDRGKEREGKLQ